MADPWGVITTGGTASKGPGVVASRGDLTTGTVVFNGPGMTDASGGLALGTVGWGVTKVICLGVHVAEVKVKGILGGLGDAASAWTRGGRPLPTGKILGCPMGVLPLRLGRQGARRVCINTGATDLDGVARVELLRSPPTMLGC